MIPVRCKNMTIMMALLMLLMIGYSVRDSKAGVAPLPPEPICPGAGNADKIGWVELTVSTASANFVGADLFLAERLPAGFVTGGVDWFYNSIFSFSGSNVVPQIQISGNDLVFRGSFLNTTITGSQLISKYNQKDTRNTSIEVANTARGVCQYGFFPFGVRVMGTDVAAVDGPGSGQFDPIVRECGDNIDCVPTANVCEGPGPVPGSGTCLLSGTPCSGDEDCATCLHDPVQVHVEVLDEGCNEICDFCDSYTPRDKHVYDLGNLVRNTGVAVACGDTIPGTEGIFVVTAVKDCEGAQQARDYNFLYGDMRLIDPRLAADYGENLQTRLAISARGTCRLSGESCFVDESLNFPDFTCEGDNCEGAIIGFCNTDGGGQCFNDTDCSEQGTPAPCVSTGGEGPANLGSCSITDGTCQNFIDPCQYGCCEVQSDDDDNDVVNCNLPDCRLSLSTCEAWNACEDNNECILDGSGCPDHCLTGDIGCELVSYLPRFLRKDFSVIPDPALAAGADVVKLAIADVYDEDLGFRYRVGSTNIGGAPSVTYAENVCDDAEDCNSCGAQTACYDRIGLNDALPEIDPPNPVVATPTPTPIPSPTPTPGIPCTEDDDCPDGFVCGDFVEPDMGICIPGCTLDHPCPAGEECVGIDPVTGVGMCQALPTPTPTPAATPTPTPKSGNFGAGGTCNSVASAAPVQLGTAMANILIPLVPALAIGFRMIRRKKKGQK